MKLLSFVFLIMVATPSFSQNTNLKILFDDVREHNNVFALISLDELLSKDQNGYTVLNINETSFAQIRKNTCKSYLAGAEFLQLDVSTASYVRSYCDAGDILARL